MGYLITGELLLVLGMPIYFVFLVISTLAEWGNLNGF